MFSAAVLYNDIELKQVSVVVCAVSPMPKNITTSLI